jgi:hypothetical protein
VLIPAYCPHDPALTCPFPWGTTAAGAQWLDTLVHRVPWDRCGVEQRYFLSVEAVQEANTGVPGLEGMAAEAWYAAYMERVEGLCEDEGGV